MNMKAKGTFTLNASAFIIAVSVASLMLASLWAGGCNVSEPGDQLVCMDSDNDGYDDETGERCHPRHGGHDGTDGGTIPSTDGGVTPSGPCGAPPAGGYWMVITSDMSGRQEVFYLLSGSDEEKMVQMTAGRAVCIPVTKDPAIIAVILKCGGSSFCPDPAQPTPALTVETTQPEKVIYSFFGQPWVWTGTLKELPPFGAHFDHFKKIGPLPQQHNRLVTTGPY